MVSFLEKFALTSFFKSHEGWYESPTDNNSSHFWPSFSLDYSQVFKKNSFQIVFMTDFYRDFAWSTAAENRYRYQNFYENTMGDCF